MRPKQMANDIWRAGEQNAPPELPFFRRRVTPLLHLWWAGYVAVTATTITWSRDGGGSLEHQRDHASEGIVLDVATIVVGLLAIATVWAVSRRHDARLRVVAPTAR